MIDQQLIRRYSRFIFRYFYECREQNVPRGMALQTAQIASTCFFDRAFGPEITDPEIKDLHEQAIVEAFGKYYGKGEASA